MPDPIANINITYREDDLPAIDKALAKVTADRVKCLAILEERAKPPVVVTPEKPEIVVGRTSITLTEPYPIKGKRLIAGLDIDASKVKRVFDLANDSKLTVRDCNIVNAHSIIEKDVRGCLVEFDRVVCGDTENYAVYLDSDGAYEKVVNSLILRNTTFGSSRNQTPVRCMPGVAVAIFDSRIYDVIDKGGDKANQGLRAHCNEVYIEDSVIGRWARIHPTSDGKNHSREECLQSGIFLRTKFDGGVRLAKGIKKLRFTDCVLDATKGKTGWALSKGYEGIVNEQRLDLVLERCTLIGKVDKNLGKFIDCVDGDGKAI